ncbi:aldose 1-epimerase family protein [Neorhizobium galegae]|uniref:aldose 1-epimerase family protein n=1 Tax=Neorhizobium galegae TaxID=399 RepID=UPI000621BFAA|nr:aldose 1-epimerase family protein [Neorhizobium galegae]CDZ55560.1 Putative thioredoxin-like protein [Neorhizobium galegae bv. orientalis]
MRGPAEREPLAARELSQAELRQRTVDGRGVADIRLLEMEDGTGRGQRLLVVRNAAGIGFEVALDRGFDIASATWRGANIGWNSANGLPWPPNSLDAEDGVGFYRNFDGFIVTCGLDHIGGAKRSDAGHFIHKHRKQVFHPLHGRVSSQRATLSGYGIDWSASAPVIWAEGVVRQSSVFAENLLLRRRVEIDVFGNAIRLNDVVENQGFRPTPHAILYHVNFGYPFLDEATQIAGDLSRDLVSAFNGEDKRPRADFVDYFQETPVVCDRPEASVELRNSALLGGVRVRLTFPREALPTFGIWRAYQSGVYALALEPTRRFEPDGNSDNGSLTLGAGDTAEYWMTIDLRSMP